MVSMKRFPSKSCFPVLFAVLVGLLLTGSAAGESDEDKAAQAIEAAWVRLLSPEVYVDPDRQSGIIRSELLPLGEPVLKAMTAKLRHPTTDVVSGRVIDRTREVFMARQVLKAMGEPALQRLLELSAAEDPFFKRNILYALSDFDRQEAIDILVTALDDRSQCKKVTPETFRRPLRVCDEAYNLLVLKLSPPGLRAPLGQVHTLDQRDERVAAFRAWWEDNRSTVLSRF